MHSVLNKASGYYVDRSMAHSQGKFIVFEGGEGCGKDTQIDLLKNRLRDRTDVIFTREPGGTVAGEEIRSLILKDRTPALQPETELLLFLAARAELMEQVIRPALDNGKVVISNRFGLSTIAYQIYGRQRPQLLPLLKEVSEKIVGRYIPHYLLIDIPPEVGRSRVESRGVLSRFDADSLDFHARVREGYLKNVGMGAESVIIDGTGSISDVEQKVWDTIESWT